MSDNDGMTGYGVNRPVPTAQEKKVCDALSAAVKPYKLRWAAREPDAQMLSGFLVSCRDGAGKDLSAKEFFDALIYAFNAIGRDANMFPMHKNCWVDGSTIRSLTELPEAKMNELCAIFGQAFKDMQFAKDPTYREPAAAPVEAKALTTEEKLARLSDSTADDLNGRLSFERTDAFEHINMHDLSTEAVGPGYIVSKQLDDIDPTRGQQHMFRERLHDDMPKTVLKQLLYQVAEKADIPLNVDSPQMKVTSHGLWISEDMAHRLADANPQHMREALIEVFAPKQIKGR